MSILPQKFLKVASKTVHALGIPSFVGESEILMSSIQLLLSTSKKNQLKKKFVEKR